MIIYLFSIKTILVLTGKNSTVYSNFLELINPNNFLTLACGVLNQKLHQITQVTIPLFFTTHLSTYNNCSKHINFKYVYKHLVNSREKKER